MKRRSIFSALAGLLGAKALPAEPVEKPTWREPILWKHPRSGDNPLFKDKRFCLCMDNKTGKIDLYSYVMTPDGKAINLARANTEMKLITD